MRRGILCKCARGTCAIDPRRSTLMVLWDLLTAIALAFTAVATPYEVGFLSAPASWSAAITDPLFWLNRFVDVLFTIDMILQFFLMYPEHRSRSSLEGARWICLLYTSPSPRDRQKSRMPSSA